MPLQQGEVKGYDFNRSVVEFTGDLLSGSKNSYIATLVERHTRYVMLAKVANKDTVCYRLRRSRVYLRNVS
jgi:IS30 family transposase